MNLSDSQRRFLFGPAGPFYRHATFRMAYQRTGEQVESVVSPALAYRLGMRQGSEAATYSPSLVKRMAQQRPEWRRISRASGGKSIILYKKPFLTKDPSVQRHERIHALLNAAPGVDEHVKAYMLMDELRNVMGLGKRQFRRLSGKTGGGPLQEVPAYSFEKLNTARRRQAAVRFTNELERRYGKEYADKMRGVIGSK